MQGGSVLQRGKDVVAAETYWAHCRSRAAVRAVIYRLHRSDLRP